MSLRWCLPANFKHFKLSNQPITCIMCWQDVLLDTLLWKLRTNSCCLGRNGKMRAWDSRVYTWCPAKMSQTESNRINIIQNRYHTKSTLRATLLSSCFEKGLWWAWCFFWPGQVTMPKNCINLGKFTRVVADTTSGASGSFQKCWFVEVAVELIFDWTLVWGVSAECKPSSLGFKSIGTWTASQPIYTLSS